MKTMTLSIAFLAILGLAISFGEGHGVGGTGGAGRLFVDQGGGTGGSGRLFVDQGHAGEPVDVAGVVG